MCSSWGARAVGGLCALVSSLSCLPRQVEVCSEGWVMWCAGCRLLDNVCWVFCVAHVCCFSFAPILSRVVVFFDLLYYCVLGGNLLTSGGVYTQSKSMQSTPRPRDTEETPHPHTRTWRRQDAWMRGGSALLTWSCHRWPLHPSPPWDTAHRGASQRSPCIHSGLRW